MSAQSSVGDAYYCPVCRQYYYGGFHNCFWGTSAPTFPAPVVAPKAPHCCPVCGGKKAVEAGFYGDAIKSDGAKDEQCRSCSGTGIVWG